MKFEIDEQEANQVVQALAKQPFETVFQLIAKIQRQAAEQLQPKPKKAKKNDPQQSPQ